jgi:hypothetical protein
MNIEVVMNDAVDMSMVAFHDHQTLLIDIDFLFKDANSYYSNILTSMYLTPEYDFSCAWDKSLYTHAFIITVCEYIKNNSSPYKICFYSYNRTKDTFRNKLISKVKKIFGFKILEGDVAFFELVEKIENLDATIIPDLEVFFAQTTKPKTFKYIKRYTKQHGLKTLKDEYFKDIANKMVLFT